MYPNLEERHYSNDCIADLSAKCQNVEAILNQMKNNLSSITKLDRHLITVYTKVNIHLGDIQVQMIKIHNLNIKQGSDGTKAKRLSHKF